MDKAPPPDPRDRGDVGGVGDGLGLAEAVAQAADVAALKAATSSLTEPMIGERGGSREAAARQIGEELGIAPGTVKEWLGWGSEQFRTPRGTPERAKVARFVTGQIAPLDGRPAGEILEDLWRRRDALKGHGGGTGGRPPTYGSDVQRARERVASFCYGLGWPPLWLEDDAVLTLLPRQGSDVAAAPYVVRDSDAELRAKLDRAFAPESGWGERVVVVAGPPASGKTRSLLQALREAARARGLAKVRVLALHPAPPPGVYTWLEEFAHALGRSDALTHGRPDAVVIVADDLHINLQGARRFWPVIARLVAPPSVVFAATMQDNVFALTEHARARAGFSRDDLSELKERAVFYEPALSPGEHVDALMPFGQELVQNWNFRRDELPRAPISAHHALSVPKSSAPPAPVDELALGVAVMALLRHAGADYVSVFESLGLKTPSQLLNLMEGSGPPDPATVLERVIAGMCGAKFFASESQEDDAATFLKREAHWPLLDAGRFSRLREKRKLVLPGTALEQEVSVALRAPQLRDHHRTIVKPFKKLIGLDDLRGIDEGMRGLERNGQRGTGPATLLDYSRLTFQVRTQWGPHLEPDDQAQAQSHIAFTNRAIVKRFLELAPRDRQTLRVVDGGCGQGAFLVELCGQLGRSRARPPKIEYFGCDIDPVATILTNELLNLRQVRSASHGTPTDAARTVHGYPGQVAALAPDERWRGAQRFVEWDDMVSAFDRLARQGQDGDHKPIRGTVDVVVFSCSFHHVANNRAFAESLGEPSSPLELRHLFQLSEALDESAGLERPLRRLYGAAAVFYEVALDPRRPRSSSIDEVRWEVASDLRSLTDSNSVSAPENLRYLKQYVSDEQAMLLASSVTLLRPGGLLIIADPDGTSLWNRNNVTEIQKLPFTHFVSEAQCRQLVEETAGLDYYETRRIVQPVLPSHHDRNIYEFVSPEDAVRSRYATTIGQLQKGGFVDDNLVFVVIARRRDDR